MSKNKISFECDETAASLYVKILQKLSEQKNLKIRIGGDEYQYLGNNDVISELCFDDRASLSTQELADINNKRTDYLLALSVTKNTNPTGGNTMNADGTDGTDGTDTTNTSVTPPNSNAGLDDSVKAQVEAVVKEFVDKNSLFTAFDITREVRKRGFSGKHGDMKRMVHQAYLSNGMPNYDRTNIQIDTVTGTPFLYHPIGLDPNDYFQMNNLTGSVAV